MSNNSQNTVAGIARRLCFAIALLLACLVGSRDAHAQSGGFPDTPGSDIHSASVTTPGADYGHATFTWGTGAARTSLVEMDPSAHFPGDDPAFNLFYYSGTLTTSHSMSVPVIPGSTACFTLAGSTNATAYRSGDASQTPGAPFGSQVNHYCFNTATPPTSDTFAATITLTGPAPSSGYPFQGHGSNFGITAWWSDGPVPSNLAVTALSIDGHPCTMAIEGGTCGTSGQGSGHITTQYIESDQEVLNSGTNNYITQIYSGGTSFDGDYYNGSAALGGPQSYIRVLPDTNSLNLGSHQLCVTIQWVNIVSGVYTAVGAPASACLNFTVSAPTFTISTPGAFPGVTSVAAWNGRISTYLNDIIAFQTANLTDPGGYLNDTGSADEYTYNTTGFAAYDATRAELGISDYLNAAATSWATGTNYAAGKIVLANGYWWNETAASCTSANTGSGPSGTTVNASVSDGSCTWTNYATQLWWETQAQRIGTQQRDWELRFGRYVTWQEYNLFTGGELMICGRGNPACAGSLEADAIAYAGWPFWGGSYPNYTQKTQYSAIATPALFTWRTTAYALNDCVDQWYASGTKPVNGGVDECGIRSDLLLDGFMQLVSCAPRAAISTTWPCPANVQIYPINFDFGFSAESEMKYCRALKHFNGSCDQTILYTLAKLPDWIYSNEFNQLGEYAEPYSGFGVPILSTNYDEAQNSLNNLTAEIYAFVGATTGNANLPTSGVPAFTAANTYLTHTFDNVVDGGLSGKEGSQWFKARQNIFQMLYGNWAWYQSDEQPAFNSYVSSWPNKMEPYLAAGIYPTIPSPTALCGPNSCTFYTYFSKAAVSTYVKWCASSGCDPLASGTTVAAGPGTLYDANANLYLSTITGSGMPSSTTGNWGWGACDGAGNCGQSAYNISLGGCCFTFTTTGAPTVSITTSSPLPSGTALTAYSTTMACTGGTPPYSWLVTFGGVPGLSVNASTGVYSGTPSTAGVYEVSFRCTDSASPSNVANKAFPGLSIAPSPTAVPTRIGGQSKIGGQAVVH